MDRHIAGNAHEPAGRRRRIQVRHEDEQRSTLAFGTSDDGAKVCDGACQPVNLRHDKHDAVPLVVEGGF
jgi:hypothetical protein